METLGAQLTLDVSPLTAALQQATQAVAAFAQRTQQVIQGAAQSFGSLTQAQQTQTQQTQQTTQSTNTLAAAYLAMAQTIQQQTQAYTRAQEASLAFRQEQARLREEQRAATAETTRWGEAMRQAFAVAGGLGLVSSLRSLTRAVKDFVTDSISGFAEFQAGILKIGTQIKDFTAGESFTQMGKQVHDLAITFGRDTGDINKALFELQGTFGNTAKAMEVLQASGRLAVAGFGNMFDAAAAVSGVIKGMHLEVSESTKVAQALLVAAQQGRQDVGQFARSIAGLLPSLGAFRIDLREAGAAMAVLTAENFTAGEAVTALSRLFFAIGAPTQRASKYIDELAAMTGKAKIGFILAKDGTVDLMATLKQFEGIPPDLLRRIIPNETSLKALLTFQGDMGGIKTKMDEAKDSTDALARAQALATAAISEQWKRTTQALNAFMDTLGSIVGQSPAVLRFVADMREAFIALTERIVQNKGALGDLLTTFADFGSRAVAILRGVGEAAIWVSTQLGTMTANISRSQLEAQMRTQIPALQSGGGGDVGPAAFETPLGGGPVISPPRPPRTVSLAEVQEAERLAKEAAREQKRAAEEAERLAKEAARERKRLENEAEREREQAMDDAIRDAKDFLKQMAALEDERAREQMESMQETIDVLHDEWEARQEVLRGMAELDRMAGKATSTFELQRVKIHQLAAELRAIPDIDIAKVNATEQEALARVSTEEYLSQVKELDKAQRTTRQAWNELGNDIEGVLSSVFEGVLSGSMNLWDAMRQGFIRLLANMAADAVAHAVIIPMIQQVMGGGVGGVGSTAMGIEGQASRIAGGNPIIQQWLNTPIPGTGGPSGAGAVWPGAPGGGYYAAPGRSVTVGQAAGGAMAGVGTGMLFSQGFSQMGLHGTANRVLAGGAGGAVAGASIGGAYGGPQGAGYGAIVGGVIGLLGGALSGLFGGKQRPAQFDIRGVQSGQVGYDALQGLTQTRDFDIQSSGIRNLGDTPGGVGAMITKLNASVNGLFATAIQGFQSATPEVQALLVAPMNAIGDQMKTMIQDTHFTGENWQEQMATFFETELPAAFTDLVQPLQAAVTKISPVLEGFTQVIDTLTSQIAALVAQRRAFNEQMGTQINELAAAQWTPEGRFQQSQRDLTDLQTRFTGGTAEARISLAPQIAQLATAIFQNARGSFTNDNNAIIAMQHALDSQAQQSAFTRAQADQLMSQFRQGDAFTRSNLGPQIQQLYSQYFQQQQALANRQLTAPTAPTAPGAAPTAPTALAAPTAPTPLPDVLRQLQASTQTPAQQYASVLSQLDSKMYQFRRAGAGQQATLAPEIQQLGLQAMELAKSTDVLGQDQGLLRQAQARITAQVKEVQDRFTATQQAAYALAQRQVALMEEENQRQYEYQRTQYDYQQTQYRYAQAQYEWEQAQYLFEQAQVDAAKAGLEALQAELVAALQEVQTGTGDSLTTLQDVLVAQLQSNQVLADVAYGELQAALQGQLDQATQQVQLLTASVSALATVDATLQTAVGILTSINAAMGNAPAFQSGSHYIPHNMLARLHAGEEVVPAHRNGGGGSTHVTINIQGAGMNERQLTDHIIQAIELRSSRFGSTRIQVN